MSQDAIVLYGETARELKTTEKIVHQYCRDKILDRAILPGFKRARGVTRQSLNRLLERIASGDAGKVVGHE